MVRTAKILYLWAMADPTLRRAQLQQAMDSAIAGMMENQGREITQGNVGDASFQFDSGSMPTDQWIEAIAIAIQSIDAGTFIGARNVVRVKFRN